MKIETLKKDNRKKWIIGSIVILMLVSTIFFVATRANYKVTEKVNIANGIINWSPSDLDIIAIKISNDGTNYSNADTIPASGYKLNSEKSVCKINSKIDKTILIKYIGGDIILSNLKKGAKCDFYFDKVNIVEYLIAKNEMIQENGYRYEGRKPNNYVNYNNEIWRIIGVFNVENSITNETENLVKLIRDNSIGNIAWDTGGTQGINEWSTSDLKNILNGQYLNGESINYTYKNASKGTVTISNMSINNVFKNMIQSVKWNIGGVNSRSLNADEMYNAEITALKWAGYVGLMYLSDYAYSADSELCSRTTTLYDYDNTLCKTNNWLLSADSLQWTLTRNSSNKYDVWDTSDTGPIVNHYAFIQNAVRPSIYLKSGVFVTGGDGTIDNPYTLSI